MNSTRKYWIETLNKIFRPFLVSASQRKLHIDMPLEDINEDRLPFANLEGVGRTLMGIAPWLEHSAKDAQEEALRQEFCTLARQAVISITDENSPDYACFDNTYGDQPLVDAAFLAQAILRSPVELWEKFSDVEKQNIIKSMESSRSCTVAYCNWLLFAACVETFFSKVGHSYDRMRIDFALKSHSLWYKGDGAYGDGNAFHWDYYNSFVIIPMMNDILLNLPAGHVWSNSIDTCLKRTTRSAEVLERMISKDGTYPPMGRSLCYRFGAMQTLSQAAYLNILSEHTTKSQVRCALTAVIRRTMQSKSMFDDNGWLTMGLYGRQPKMGEPYLSRGSLYLCSAIFLPLGLDEDDEFWAGEDKKWLNVQIWDGEDTVRDHNI